MILAHIPVDTLQILTDQLYDTLSCLQPILDSDHQAIHHLTALADLADGLQDFIQAASDEHPPC